MTFIGSNFSGFLRMTLLNDRKCTVFLQDPYRFFLYFLPDRAGEIGFIPKKEFANPAVEKLSFLLKFLDCYLDAIETTSSLYQAVKNYRDAFSNVNENSDPIPYWLST